MFSVLKIWLVLDGNIGQVVEKKVNLKSQKLFANNNQLFKF